MEKEERFLPIGTVVMLKGGSKKAMITGFCSIAEEDKSKMYDYMGCVYPEGYLDFSQICLFDHDQIEKIYYHGYIDEEEKEFKEELKQVASQYEQGNEELKNLIENFDHEDEEGEEEDQDNEELLLPEEQKLENFSHNNTDDFEYL